MTAATRCASVGLTLIVAILLVVALGSASVEPNAPPTQPGGADSNTPKAAEETVEPNAASASSFSPTQVSPDPPGGQELPPAQKSGSEMVAKTAPTTHDAAVKAAQQKRPLREKVQQNPTAAYQQATTLFMDKCSSCHGEKAYGDGPWSTEFEPHPANLSLVNDSPAMLRSIVLNGISGTMMPGFTELSNDNTDGIFKYVGLEARDLSNQWAYPWELHTKMGKAMETPDLGAAKLAFAGSCSGCHGSAGKGDGFMAKIPAIWPKPANLTARNSDIGRLYYIVTEGRKGTFMAYNKDKIPELGRWQLASYVHSLYDANSPDNIREPQQAIPTLTNPNLRTDLQVAEHGRKRYSLWCSPCHGEDGRGSFLAPRLIDRTWKYAGGTDTAVFTVVENGVPGKLMPSFKEISEDERWAIITFLRSRGGLPDPLAQPTPPQTNRGTPSEKAKKEGK